MVTRGGFSFSFFPFSFVLPGISRSRHFLCHQTLHTQRIVANQLCLLMCIFKAGWAKKATPLQQGRGRQDGWLCFFLELRSLLHGTRLGALIRRGTWTRTEGGLENRSAFFFFAAQSHSQRAEGGIGRVGWGADHPDGRPIRRAAGDKNQRSIRHFPQHAGKITSAGGSASHCSALGRPH